MQFVKTFKTKKRDWNDLVRILQYWANNNQVVKLDNSEFSKMIKEMTKNNTDWVIFMDDKMRYHFGTRLWEKSFVPFYKLEKSELKQIQDYIDWNDNISWLINKLGAE